MRLKAWVTAILVLFVPITAQSAPTVSQQTAAWIAYGDLLAKSCPDAKIPFLSPAELDLKIVSFEGLLTRAQRERAVELQRETCIGSYGGLACSNTGFLVAAKKEGYLSGFVQTMCHSGIVCTAMSSCKVPG
jgi:hypothetical protein